MLRNQGNLKRIKLILAGALVYAEDIAMFEYEFEECLIDSNYWHENSFTLYGYMRGHPKWKQYAQGVLDNSNAKSIQFEDVVSNAFEGHEYETTLYKDVMHDQPLACAFYADLINDIPEYRERFCDNLKGLLDEN